VLNVTSSPKFMYLIRPGPSLPPCTFSMTTCIASRFGGIRISEDLEGSSVCNAYRPRPTRPSSRRYRAGTCSIASSRRRGYQTALPLEAEGNAVTRINVIDCLSPPGPVP